MPIITYLSIEALIYILVSLGHHINIICVPILYVLSYMAVQVSYTNQTALQEKEHKTIDYISTVKLIK